MAYQVLMDVFDSTYDLSEIEFGLLLCDFVGLDEIIKLSFGGKLHDDKNIIGSIEYFIKFDDVRMIDEFQYFYLALDLKYQKQYFGDHIFVFHFFFVNYLHGHFDSSEIVSSFYKNK